MYARNQCQTSLKRPTSSNLTDRGWVAVRTGTGVVLETPAPVDVAGREATGKACGVAVAIPQGHSWAPPLSNGVTGNVGTLPAAPPRSAPGEPAGRLVAS